MPREYITTPEMSVCPPGRCGQSKEEYQLGEHSKPRTQHGGAEMRSDILSMEGKT